MLFVALFALLGLVSAAPHMGDQDGLVARQDATTTGSPVITSVAANTPIATTFVGATTTVELGATHTATTSVGLPSASTVIFGNGPAIAYLDVGLLGFRYTPVTVTETWIACASTDVPTFLSATTVSPVVTSTATAGGTGAAATAVIHSTAYAVGPDGSTYAGVPTQPAGVVATTTTA